ncbi:sphingosine 1-phosphate receptor 2-like [Stylophora pistillata]|uniref:sphingosine 1-phosphate receptor 2-like n=1 Tax=Stylophora pistillata TaxID=50429 RepID=UPI000C047FA8|nr:sphingosine 1-phosphate receptor 2-like [Stylophora pistillata]
METWFWVLGWFLCMLTMVGNGFVIFLVCNKRQLRTKTNTFIVSLAVTDFCVGMIAAPSRFLYAVVKEHISDDDLHFTIYAWPFILYAFGTNLLSLILERSLPSNSDCSYILGNSFSFTLTTLLMNFNSIDRIEGYLYLLYEVISCVILIFCLVSMFLVVHKHNSRDRNLAKQLQFNQRVAKVKTRGRSALKWVALVTSVFLLCYGIYMRCSLIILFDGDCKDFRYKVPLQLINSGINPIAYAFLKRDMKQECKRLLFKRCR